MTLIISDNFPGLEALCRPHALIGWEWKEDQEPGIHCLHMRQKCVNVCLHSSDFFPQPPIALIQVC